VKWPTCLLLWWHRLPLLKVGAGVSGQRQGKRGQEFMKRNVGGLLVGRQGVRMKNVRRGRDTLTDG
jgi:hypothetical protein